MFTDYAQPLRTIGQDLEMLHVEDFNMENNGNDFLVRGEANPPAQKDSRSEDLQATGFWMPWRILRGGLADQKQPAPESPPPVALELRYTPQDLDRLEHEGRARRNDPNMMPDPNSLSQILRALGAYVNRKDVNLLEVSKQGQSLTIHYETAEGSRNSEELTANSMYDFCVHMYMKRSHRGRG